MPKRNQKEIDDERELKINPVNVFTCGCGKANEVKAPDFMIHLKEAHGIDQLQAKGKRSMLAHIDGSYWFSWNYAWELESGLKFSQYIRMARAEDDMMRFA